MLRSCSRLTWFVGVLELGVVAFIIPPLNKPTRKGVLVAQVRSIED
jgi:hypothetical protein